MVKTMLKTNHEAVKTISEQELESYLWQAANILRGVIDASEYKSIIFPLMFFKRISDAYDEEYEEAIKESKGDTEYASYPEQGHTTSY